MHFSAELIPCATSMAFHVAADFTIAPRSVELLLLLLLDRPWWDLNAMRPFRSGYWRFAVRNRLESTAPPAAYTSER